MVHRRARGNGFRLLRFRQRSLMAHYNRRVGRSGGRSHGVGSGEKSNEEYLMRFHRPQLSRPAMAAFAAAALLGGALAAGHDASAATVNATIAGFAFSPNPLTVAPGDTVVFQNNDSAPHTATSDTAGQFDTGQIASGASGSFTAPSAPGSYPYHCNIHPNMTATLVVQAAGGGGSTSTPAAGSTSTPAAGSSATPTTRAPSAPSTGTGAANEDGDVPVAIALGGVLATLGLGTLALSVARRRA
jgi:plastocyanin